jgi:hypothetical protein
MFSRTPRLGSGAVVASLELIGEHAGEKTRDETEKRRIAGAAQVEKIRSNSDDPGERDPVDGAVGTQKQVQPGKKNVHVHFERQAPHWPEDGNAAG